MEEPGGSLALVPMRPMGSSPPVNGSSRGRERGPCGARRGAVARAATARLAIRNALCWGPFDAERCGTPYAFRATLTLWSCGDFYSFEKRHATCSARWGLPEATALNGKTYTNLFYRRLNTMSVLLRCSKCGSDSGFLIETQERKTLEVKAKLPLDRIKKAVLVTCTYCNNRWDHVPISLTDRSIDEAMMRRAEGETKLVPKQKL